MLPNFIDDTNDIVVIRPRKSQPRKSQIKKIKKQIFFLSYLPNYESVEDIVLQKTSREQRLKRKQF